MCIFFTLFFATSVFSQSYRDAHYRNFSLTLSGGATLGDVNDANYFLSSDFSTNIETTATFGAGLQYALTPAWSLDLGYRYASIKGQTQSFETDMNLFTLKNIVNINQLLFVNLISERVNPFISAGVGYDLFTYNGSDANFSDQNSSYNAGVGVLLKASSSIDLFTHYEYHMASNATDNETEGFGSDLVNSLTGGIRINFGKKETTHPSWRPVPVDLSPSDYDRLMARADLVDELETRMKNLEQLQADSEKRLVNEIRANTSEINSLKARMDRLENRMDVLEDAFSSLEDSVETLSVNTETGMAESLASGHYVQIFASRQADPARDVRSYALQKLGGILQNSDQQIMIIRRKDFFEVIIGVFSEYESAEKVRGIMGENHDDAYIITFPRPLSLQEDFEDLEVFVR